ncbi:hypothetical protein F5882DRAFT_451534 [Hyaloscypha sp. PMI_1271]|nr:hypothetical protein F5882DRAFT_451534 [Hyaloscypha sp. PMI_1271]
MEDLTQSGSACVKSEGIVEVIRYDISIYGTPFSKLPDPKRVWLWSPSSALEGLGRFSLLTPEVVSAAAASEIKTDRRVGLNWNMKKLGYSQFGRQSCSHKVIPVACFDDVYEMNPQQSSQWDGFRHYSQPLHTNEPSTSKDRVYYGGTTKEEIMDSSNHRIGIQHWESEGIAGRGVLLDYHRWASSQSPPIKYSCFSTHAVSFESILAMCRAEDVTPRKGGILFIRIGMMPEWETFTEQQKKEYAAQEEAEHAGVEAPIELLEWLWDSGITAVAGDAISWEVFPTPGEVSMHEYLLGGWGMPIGTNGYSFFLTSMPLNMPGGVSSPPNSMAIF